MITNQQREILELMNNSPSVSQNSVVTDLNLPKNGQVAVKIAYRLESLVGLGLAQIDEKRSDSRCKFYQITDAGLDALEGKVKPPLQVAGPQRIDVMHRTEYKPSQTAYYRNQGHKHLLSLRI